MNRNPLFQAVALIIGCALAAPLLMPDTASAIPAYARKYNMSCNVCHLVVPVLKDYGNEFAAAGYQIPGKEPARFTRETGDPMLSLMRELPLAIRIDGFARYLPDAGVKGDIQWPFIIKILSSGQIKKDISYFFYFLFNEEGEVAGVEDAFLHFNDIGGADFDILVGQYQVADPIFKRELRPTFEDYEIYKARPGMSRADLTYDRGIVLNYTLPAGTDCFLSVVNGNGIGASSGGVFDNDPNKNLFVRVAQPLDSAFSIGSLGYFGREDASGERNNTTMAGGDVSLGIGSFGLGGQFVYRRDSNPWFAAAGSGINTRGGFAQLSFAPELERSSWYAFLLYNRITSDATDLEYHSVAGNFSYLLARNFKLMAEYGYDIEDEFHSFTVGFMTAF